MKTFWRGTILLMGFFLVTPAKGFVEPAKPALPDLDKRRGSTAPGLPVEKAMAVEQLRIRLPQAQIDFEPLLLSPKMIFAADGFLSGPNAQGRALAAQPAPLFASNDPHLATRAFLTEHRALFGYGPEALDAAVVKQDYVARHNGLHTVVWEQQLEGIPVFEAVFISHTTKQDELVSISSQFVPDPARAAEAATPNHATLVAAPRVGAAGAIAAAALQTGDEIQPSAIGALAASEGAARHQRFRSGGLKGDADARLVWLPLDADRLRLCWEIFFVSGARDEMFQSLVDVETGEVLVRHSRTSYSSDATYDVYTSDSPSPMPPGLSTPSTNQPPYVSRVLIMTNAVSTNASPAGWINDGNNETRGNNVDAHLDRNADNLPDLPRPQGSPARVFDFPLDLNQDPTNYQSAAVTQLFYWCNWMHDKLYDLGFTEAAGNFQETNWDRGGLGGDSVQADAQDGGGVNNANFHTTPDGTPGSRMQMYLWSVPNPRRDGDLDAEIILHEYTHGLSNRRVGGGVGINFGQARGMGEGWSDFFALSLLSDPADDPDAVYAMGGYAIYGFFNFTNYYFGIRRFPYTTDMSKNPLTFKDVDPSQADRHAGIPRSFVDVADEIHNQGEIWCVTLREARASLIHQYGGAAGNQLMLQIVMDALPLTPPNPNWIQARDAILLADRVDNGGTNLPALWNAFAKRGLGFSATAPPGTSTYLIGMHESFDLPDDLLITPLTGFAWSGKTGQAFPATNLVYALTNAGSNTLTWSAGKAASWLSLSSAGGTLAPGQSAQVIVTLDSPVTNLPTGAYSDLVQFSNISSGQSSTRPFDLNVQSFATMPFSENFESGAFVPYWLVSGAESYRTLITSQNGPHGGSYHVTMDSSVTNWYEINELTLGVDLSGYTNVLLTFWVRGYFDELQTSLDPFLNRADIDAVAISNDGLHWYPVRPIGPVESIYVNYAIDLDPTVRAYGLTYNSTFRIRFNHYDNNPISPVSASSDGIAFDDISVTGKRAGILDHFDFNNIAVTQTVNEPFLVHVTAKDVFGQTLSNFTGTVSLTGLAGPLTNKVFGDDFEDGDFSDWTIGTGAYTRAITNSTAAGGTNSFTQIGGTGNSRYNGVSHSLASLTPKRVNFSIRAAAVNKIGGYVGLGTAASDTSMAVFFAMFNSGYIDVVSPSLDHYTPYDANRWYRISFVFDWPNHRFNFYVDNEPVEFNVPFRSSSVNNLTQVYLYNFDFSQFWWDEIEMLADATPPTDPITPAVTANFLNGQWLGNARLLSASTNIYLRADDGAGHPGYGNTFTVIPFVDSDGDGMPDDWESAHGLNPNDPSDAMLDSDGDGMSNLAEYLSGTDPNDPASALRIISIQQTGVTVKINFSTVAGKLYRLETSGELKASNWTVAQDAIEGTGSPIEVSESFSAADAARFYRVALVQ